MRNYHLALMVSQGVPMLLMGDEYGHTKYGNNNSWGHDSRLNWFQWDTLEKSPEFFRFYKMVIAFRKAHPVLFRSKFLREGDVTWHGKEPDHPDWGPKSRFVAFTLPDPIYHYDLYVAFNAFYRPTTLKIPKPKGGHPWLQIIDTSNESPKDIVEEAEAKPLTKHTYTLPAYSALLLKSYWGKKSH